MRRSAYKVTGTGKIMRRKVNRNHILEKKPSKRTRRLAGTTEVTGGDSATASDASSASDRPRPRRKERPNGTRQGWRSRQEEAPGRPRAGRRATTATAAAASGRPTRRSCTRGSTRSATVGPARARCASSGSSASTRPAAERHQLQPVHRRPEGSPGIEVDRKVLADLAVRDADAVHRV